MRMIQSSASCEAKLYLIAVMLALLLGTLLKEALEYVQVSNLRMYTHKVSDKITRKRLHMFFQTYENKEVRDLGDRADLVVALPQAEWLGFFFFSI